MTQITGLGSNKLDRFPTPFTNSGRKEMRGTEGQSDDGEETVGRDKGTREMAKQREHRHRMRRTERRGKSWRERK